MNNCVFLYQAIIRTFTKQIALATLEGGEQDKVSRVWVNNAYRREREKGVALVVVLLILAIMVALAASMSERLFISFRQVENRLHYQQAYWYSISVEALAKVVIEQSYKESPSINLSQPWAMDGQSYPLDYGTAFGKIRDMHTCFNVNALSNLENATQQGVNQHGISQQSLQLETQQTPYLLRIWQTLLYLTSIDDYQAEIIADSTLEYIDRDSVISTQYGVEESTYESLQPSYLTANSLLADVSELRAIYQVDSSSISILDSLLCALPTDKWQLNVNTIDQEASLILVALFSSQLTVDEANDLIENRPFDGWGSVEEFLAVPSIDTVEELIKDRAINYLAVDSQFFELDAQIEVAQSQIRIKSLLFSADREKVKVVRRQFGGGSE